MKTSTIKYSVLVGFFLFLIACSTKKDTFINRNYHAVTTEFNILYNGEIALQKGIEELKKDYKDNFWEMLPVERMQVKDEVIIYADSAKQSNFIRAEEKATKAIQKHSMNIVGSEKNAQMDEAHMLLGKARYYEQRFIPALEAFNYILYKHSNSDKIYEAKVWREKTNIRMDYNEIAIKNLKRLLKDIEFKDQTIADANAILAQAYLNIGQKDTAIFSLQKAVQFTKSNEEKARYRFILGQLYEEEKKFDSAFIAYQSVIDMRRKSPRRYVIQAYAKEAEYFDYKKGNREAFVKAYTKLLEDRENRSYMDILNHQMGLFYQKTENDSLAIRFYNKSLRSPSENEDDYLRALNYRNLAEIHFDRAEYAIAAQYYDSTLVKMNEKAREHRDIKYKREDLTEVIKYEDLAKVNDSILNILSLSELDRISFFEKHINRLRLEDEVKKQIVSSSKNSPNLNTIASTSSLFYFYNQNIVNHGKNEFRKKWGNRALKDNWRRSSFLAVSANSENILNRNIPIPPEVKEENKYTVAYYLDKLPQEPQKIASITRERNFAYYQLGLIYKEHFKEYELAATKLEKLLAFNPDPKLILPVKYNLFLIYDIIDKNKAEQIKRDIIDGYPETRYAHILSNPKASYIAGLNDPEVVYADLYKMFEKEQFVEVLSQIDELIEKFSGESIVSKFELLKANTIGKLKGVEEYKRALGTIVLNYPNSDEGKKADDLLKKDIPILEKLGFDQYPVISWKVLYKIAADDFEKAKYMQEQLKVFMADMKYMNLKISLDNYTIDEKFIVIHGFVIEEEANGFASSLFKEAKKYKIEDLGYIISNDNYKVVQVRKNFTEYLKFKNK